MRSEASHKGAKRPCVKKFKCNPNATKQSGFAKQNFNVLVLFWLIDFILLINYVRILANFRFAKCPYLSVF